MRTLPLGLLLVACLTFAGCNAGPELSRAGGPVTPSTFRAPTTPNKKWDVPPKLISGNAPVYPITRRFKGEPGSATLSYVIDADGSVKKIKILHATYKYFGDHAVIALRDWRFQPAIKDGKPVSVEVVQKFQFQVR